MVCFIRMKTSTNDAVKFVVAGSLLFALMAHGQSPPGTAVDSPRQNASEKASVTNHDAVTSADSPDLYRVVTNHVSSPSKSPYWKLLTAKCLLVQTNSALMQEVTIERIYGADAADTPGSPYYGAAPAKHLISEKHVAGRQFILRNFPDGLTPGSAKECTFIALPIGTTNTGTELLEIWDRGVPYEKWLAQQPPSAPTSTNGAAR